MAHVLDSHYHTLVLLANGAKEEKVILPHPHTHTCTIVCMHMQAWRTR